MPSPVKIFSKDQWRFSAPREGVTLMSVIFMFSLSLANIESATPNVQKSRLKMVEAAGIEPASETGSTEICYVRSRA